MALAVQIDGKDREEVMNAATEVAVNHQIDLSSLAPGLKACVLNIRENGNSMLSVTAANNASFSHEPTNAKMSRLSTTLNNSSLSNEAKQQRVADIINNIVLANQISQSFNQQVRSDQTQTIQR